jgi:CheY-like chemotaxis protein
VLWGDELFLTETFHDPARLERRAGEFKATLEGRGWKPMPDEAAPPADSPPGGTPVAVPRPAPPGPRADGRQPSVLIVDDEPEIRNFLRSCLRQSGYAICEAEDIDSALNALDRERVDAVVLDVRLPDPMGWGRTGLEVLAFIRLHNAYTKLPVLILTGHALEPEEQDIIARHRADLFLKPDGYRLLLRRLDQLTGANQPHQ